MITVDQIRSVLQQVILSKISLDQFDEWLTKASWNMHQNSSMEAIRMVGKIELILSDYDADRISDADVVQAFWKINPVLVITNVPPGISVITSSTVVAQINQPSTPWVVFDKVPAVESSCIPGRQASR